MYAMDCIRPKIACAVGILSSLLVILIWCFGMLLLELFIILGKLCIMDWNLLGILLFFKGTMILVFFW